MSLDLLKASLTSVAVLAFALGALARFLKSDLRVPSHVHEALSMYLLFAIGLKGGMALTQVSFQQLALPAVATLFLGVVAPFAAYAITFKLGRLSRADAAALAAHYGSVSAVTFMAALTFAQQNGVSVEGFLTVLLVVLEIPGIVIALGLYGYFSRQAAASHSEKPTDVPSVRLGDVIHEALTGKSVLLLSGGMLIGAIADDGSLRVVGPLFQAPFQALLVFFLLEMGVVAASRFSEARSSLRFLLVFGTLFPLCMGLLGVYAGGLAGLSVGGAAILGTMAASASYIAAPAAVKMAIPEANAGLYLTSSVSITLPFNLALGIPLFFAVAAWLGAVVR